MSDSLDRNKLNHLLTDRNSLKTNIENKDVDTTGINTITGLDVKVNEIFVGYIGYDSVLDSVPMDFTVETSSIDTSILSVIDEIPDSTMDYCYNNSIQVSRVFSGLRKVHLRSTYSYDNTTLPNLIRNLFWLDTFDIDQMCDFSNVTTLGSIFANCKIQSFDFGWFSNSTFVSEGLSGAFTKCSRLSKVLNLDKCDFHLINTLYNTFNGCNFSRMDLSNTNLINVYTYESLFAYGHMVEFVFIPPMDVSKVQDVSYMFSNCTNLTSVDLSRFVTSSLTNVRFMFSLCSHLTFIDISGFSFVSITQSTNYLSMFYDVPDNCLIYVKDQDAKTWINTHFTNLSNVQIKEV